MKNTTPFPLGIVEGFYGVFYTAPEREDLIRWMGRHGFNAYIYGPKNDRQHRARWSEPYPPRIMAQFAHTVELARAAGITFIYAISPGLNIRYSSPDDFDCLVEKLRGFLAIGVTDFCLALDDNEPGFRHAEDAAAFGENAFGGLPEAQSRLANRLFHALLALDPRCTLSFVPAEYWGVAPFSPALVELAARLDPRIDLFYTGPEICSPTITAAECAAFAAATGRAPLLWDNYPVNDLAMQPELHLAPLTGRDPALLTNVKGMFFNPMIQAEASKIPLRTAAEFAVNGSQYDPCAAYARALDEIAGEEWAPAVNLLADVCGISCLGRGGQRLEALANDAVHALRRGEPLDAPALLALEAYLTEIDEAGYTLKFRMENLALRSNLLPWIEIMEHWMWLARFSLKALACGPEEGQKREAALRRVREYIHLINTHPKRIATEALKEIADLACSEQRTAIS